MRLFASSSDQYPDIQDLEKLRSHLIYSSSIVSQVYRNMYGGEKPEDTPERYIDLAVLEQRNRGVGTRPLSEFSPNTEEQIDSNGNKDIPTVWTLSGDLQITRAEGVNDSDMFMNTLETKHGTYKGFGSKENYHVFLQDHLEVNGSFHIGNVWATAIQISQESIEDGKIHFCQLVHGMDL